MDRATLDRVPTPRRLRKVPAAAFLLALWACDAEPRPDPPAARAAPIDSAAPDMLADPADSAAAQADPAVVEGVSWLVGTTTVDREVAGAALLRAVRTARHEGFDRIVLEFGGDAVPGYHIEYVDRPVQQCGSGETVPLAGDAWLTIRMQPANAHTEEGQPTVRVRERTINQPTLLELKMICDFEAQVEWVAAVSSPEAYRAFVLTEPGRLVIDIRHRVAR